MDAAERIEISDRLFPGHLRTETLERFPLPLPQDWKWFDDHIAKPREKIGVLVTQSLKNIPGEIAVMRSLFDDNEISGPPQRLPHLGELRRQKPSEQGTHTDIGEVIATPTDRSNVPSCNSRVPGDKGPAP